MIRLNVQYRLAVLDDCDLLFKWVNDYSVRKQSFNEQLIDYPSHKQWFKEKINNKNVKIFIVSIDEIEIGQVRIDIEDDSGYLDYSIDRNYRGKGYGFSIINGLHTVITQFDIRLKKLVAQVKYTNEPSKNIFIKAGYYEMKRSNFLEYIKTIY